MSQLTTRTAIAVQRDFQTMYDQSDGILSGIDYDEMVWLPPGMANPMALTLVHVIAGEDRRVQEALQARPLIWKRDGWADRVGIESAPRKGERWRDIDLATLQLDQLFAYRNAVIRETMTYLSSLHDSDMNEQVILGSHEETRGDALMAVVVHTTSHMGEIAALRGARGHRGRPA